MTWKIPQCAGLLYRKATGPYTAQTVNITDIYSAKSVHVFNNRNSKKKKKMSKKSNNK